MTKCVFCAGTGVHDCPGGELGPDYFHALDRLRGRDVAFRLNHGLAQYLPGLIDAEAFPQLPGWERDA